MTRMPHHSPIDEYYLFLNAEIQLKYSIIYYSNNEKISMKDKLILIKVLFYQKLSINLILIRNKD